MLSQTVIYDVMLFLCLHEALALVSLLKYGTGRLDSTRGGRLPILTATIQVADKHGQNVCHHCRDPSGKRHEMCAFLKFYVPRNQLNVPFLKLYVPQIGSAMKQPIMKAEEDSLNC